LDECVSGKKFYTNDHDMLKIYLCDKNHGKNEEHILNHLDQLEIINCRSMLPDVEENGDVCREYCKDHVPLFDQ